MMNYGPQIVTCTGFLFLFAAGCNNNRTPRFTFHRRLSDAATPIAITRHDLWHHVFGSVPDVQVCHWN